MIVELARRVSSCGWVALCERRRAGFARLSGWQPVDNWVASAANFSSIPVTRRRHPDNEQKNRDAQFAPKNDQKRSRAGTGVSQEGAENHPPRRGSFLWGGDRRGRVLRGFKFPPLDRKTRRQNSPLETGIGTACRSRTRALLENHSRFHECSRRKYCCMLRRLMVSYHSGRAGISSCEMTSCGSSETRLQQ
jgi:hypothetical protein